MRYRKREYSTPIDSATESSNMTTATQTKQTAASTYAIAAAGIDLQIAKLQNALIAHKARQADAPRNYGYAGDLRYIESQLANLVALIGA